MTARGPGHQTAVPGQIAAANSNLIGAGCRCCVQPDVGIAAHRPQYGQRHPDGGGHRLRTAPGRAAGLRPVRTQAPAGRTGLSRPGVGHRPSRRLQAAWEALSPARVIAFTAHATTLFADVGYQAGDVLMFGPEPTGLDAADPGRRAHHPAGAHSDAGGPTLAEPVQRRGDRRLRGMAAARLPGAFGAGILAPTYQVFQCVSCSAGSRLAGRKSVPLV